jgi:regulator of sigma E protease
LTEPGNPTPGESRPGGMPIRALTILALLALAIVSGWLTWEVLITLVLFIVILGVVVLVHELGHFIAARIAGVRVLEFGIGFPPRARVLRAKGETLYTLNWLPIGGFVKLAGEDGNDADDPRSFSAKPLITKLLILVAGVAMNFVLAFLIFTGITLTGDPTVAIAVDSVQPGSPAEQAGIVAGDVIEQVDGQTYSWPPFGAETLLDALRAHASQPVALTIRHADGSTSQATATIRSEADITAGKGALGIGISPDSFKVTPGGIRYAPGDALRLGWDRTVQATSLIVGGVGQLISNIVTNPTQAPGAAGPVGIATQIGDVFFTFGPVFTLYLAGILSANLGVVNILPLPPLDGGRVLVIALKSAFGRRISLRAERLTYVVGFTLLFAFLIWVTTFDVLRGGNP